MLYSKNYPTGIRPMLEQTESSKEANTPLKAF